MSIAYPLLSQPLLDLTPFDVSIPSPVSALLSTLSGPRSYLLIAHPYDRQSATYTTVYYSSDGYASHANDTLPDSTPLPHQLFRARLLAGQVFNFESRVMSSGALISSPVPAYGTTRVILADDDPDVLRDLTYNWHNCQISMYVGDPSWSLSSFVLFARGIVAEITRDDVMTYSIAWGTLAQVLQVDVQPRHYRGMGGALRFNNPPSTAYVTGTLPCPPSDLTIECWMRPATSAATIKRLVCWRNGSSGAGLRSLDIGSGGNSLPRFAIRNDASVLFTATGSTPVNVAANLQNGTHVAGVIDPVAMVIRIVVNGVTAATTPYTGTLLTVLNTVYFACNDSLSELFDGDEDEIVISNIARSDADIQSTMNAERSPTSAGVYAYYKCNDQAPGNVTVFDSVLSGGVVAGAPHNLTLTNAVWIGSLTGGPSIAGKCIPTVEGPYTKFEPVCVDDINNVYQLNDGSMVSQLTFEHRGLQPYIIDGDTADITTATPASGHIVTCLAQGVFKLNAVISGHLLVTGHGDNQGVMGYVETCSDISKKKALNAGLTNADLDLVKFATDTVMYPYPVWIGTRLDPRSVDSVIVEVRSYIMGWRTLTRDGRLTIGVLARPTSIKFYLTETNTAIDGVTMLVKSAPVKQTIMSYARYGLAQTPADLAVTNQETVTDLGQEYRTYQTSIDASVVKGDSSAAIWKPVTAIVASVDAALESAREQAYWSAGPATIRIQLTDGQFQVNIDDGVNLTLTGLDIATNKDLEGLQSGFEGVVTAIGDTVPMLEWCEVTGFMLPKSVLIGDDMSVIVASGGGEEIVSS